MVTLTGRPGSHAAAAAAAAQELAGTVMPTWPPWPRAPHWLEFRVAGGSRRGLSPALCPSLQGRGHLPEEPGLAHRGTLSLPRRRGHAPPNPRPADQGLRGRRGRSWSYRNGSVKCQPVGFSLLTEETLVPLVKGSCLPAALCPGRTWSGPGRRRSGAWPGGPAARVTECVHRVQRRLWV